MRHSQTLMVARREMVRRLPPRPESAAAARDFVRNAIADTAIDLNAAMLLTSELVNNAIVHAHTQFEVGVTTEADGVVCITVTNHAPELLLAARTSSGPGGRGLAIIDAMATAWGFERLGDAKCVWCRLEPPHP